MICFFFFKKKLCTASILSVDEKLDLCVEPTAAQERAERLSPNEHIEIKRGVTPVCRFISMESSSVSIQGILEIYF